MAVGRISGPLLKSNLIRNGIDLAFETDLLYLDVNNQRIGVKTQTPQHELDVNGTTKTNALEVANRALIGDITIEGDTISTDLPYLNLSTFDSVVSLNRLEVDSIAIEGNRIETQDSNADLEFRPNGTGSVNVESDLNVTGDVYVTGNITADGNIIIGDSDTDNVTFNAEVASDIIPDETDIYNLGSDPGAGGKEWADIYTNNLVASTINSAALDVDGIDLTLRQGNIYYVAENGDDANSGDHIQDPYASVKQALSVAQAGDSIYIFPGVYQEDFPLEIPQGVSVKGHGLRSVAIEPTPATNNKDCFLLNGETTVEDLTVKDFFYDSVNDTGYAFRYADGFTVQSRSPYIKNVSVITQGSITSSEDPRGFDSGDAGKGVFLDGAVATSSSKEASGLFHSVTFITPGVDAVTLTNGVRVEWLSSFTYFARRSVYAVDGTSGLKGQGETKLRVDGLQGSFSAGETIEYYNTDGVTLLGSATIARVDADGKFYVTGKETDFREADVRLGKTLAAGGNAQLDSSESKHGVSSLILDGVGDFVSVNSSNDFGFGTNDFTVEGWVYPTSNSGTPRIFDFRAGQSVDNAVSIDINNLTPEVYINGAYRIIGTSNLVLNSWNHLAYVRSGTTGTLYLDGVSVGSWTDTVDYGSNKPLVIGALFDTAQNFFQGNIDDVRIIQGQAVVPPAGGPVFEAVSTPETVLMARFDGENGSQQFADDTVYSQDIRFSGGASAREFSLVDFTDFGAEVRMISSASVYGDEGIVGNGPGVIVYAIGHNVSYIGNGKESTNDATSIIQANEFVELNNAKIRYSSVDQNGDFRVGELFFINQSTGDIAFSSANFSIEGEQALVFSDGVDTTTINATKVETGNIRISDNTIESLSGDINIDAFSGQINLENSVNISGDLDVTGDVSIGGNITIGDSSTDTIQFIAGIDSDIVPAEDSVYSLGTQNERWDTLFANSLFIDDIEISDNYIQTTVSNADLELRANGTGNVIVPENNVVFSQNLSVSGSTSLQDVSINGDVSVTGSINQTGDISVAGSVSVTQDITVSGSAQFEEILIDDNFITTTSSNADLELQAAGTGSIVVPSNDVEITQDLDVIGNITAENIAATNSLAANSFTSGDIVISGNSIQTTASNSDLELAASGTGEIIAENNNVRLEQDLVVQGSTSLKDTAIVGNISHVGNTVQIGNYSIEGSVSITGTVESTGSAQLEEILIDDNFITTTSSNADLELQAAGTGRVIISQNDVEISQDLAIGGTLTVRDINSSGTVRANSFTTGNVLIDDNFITTTESNSDLELRANGTGEVVVPSNDVRLQQDLTVEGNTELQDVAITGLISQTGNTVQNGNLELIGSASISDSLDVGAAAQFENIRIDGNVITTTESNSDLELKAAGTGQIVIPDNDVEITNNLAVNGTISVTSITNTVDIQSSSFSTDNILIEDNFITTTESNSDLELRTSGTGLITFEDFAVFENTISTPTDFVLDPGSDLTIIESTGNLRLPVGTTTDRPSAPQTGQIRFNTTLNRFEGYDGSYWIKLNGVQDIDGDTHVTAEQAPGANDNLIRFNIEGSTIASVDQEGLNADQITVDDIQLNGNVISTITEDSDLVLEAQGTGSVVINDLAIKDNTITNTVEDGVTVFENTNNGYVKFEGTSGLVIPVGSNLNRPPISNTELGMTRFNTDDNRVEIWDGSNWISVAGSASGISRSDAEDIAFSSVIAFG